MPVSITQFVHGTTVDNEKEISSGWNDVYFSKPRESQSMELGKYISDKKFDAIFCSGLKRAKCFVNVITEF